VLGGAVDTTVRVAHLPRRPALGQRHRPASLPADWAGWGPAPLGNDAACPWGSAPAAPDTADRVHKVRLAPVVAEVRGSPEVRSAATARRRGRTTGPCWCRNGPPRSFRACVDRRPGAEAGGMTEPVGTTNQQVISIYDVF
jgi:hypothetical protein